MEDLTAKVDLQRPSDALLLLLSKVMAEVRRVEETTGKRPNAGLVSAEDALGTELESLASCEVAGVTVKPSKDVPRGVFVVFVEEKAPLTLPPSFKKFATRAW